MATKKKTAKRVPAKKGGRKVAKRTGKKVARSAAKKVSKRGAKSVTGKAGARKTAKKTKPSAPRAAATRSKMSASRRAAAAPSHARLSAGSAVPGFALSDQSGRTVALQGFAGRKLLVYFYPKADTPGCTMQSCSVRDHRQELKSLGIDVVGISPDSPKAQAKFDQKFSLGFPLLADEDHAVAEAFGVWTEKSMYGRKYMGILRSSFLIDEKGRVIGAWYGVKPDETVPNARAALAR